MHKISLASHSIRVRKHRNKDEYEPLGSIGGVGLHCILRECLEEMRREHRHDAGSQSLQGAQRLEGDKESIWGVVEGGDYGFSSQFVNVETRAKSHRRTPKEAELVPYYFLINCPANAKSGLVLLQRHGSKGIQTSFFKALREALASKATGYTIEFEPQVPAEVLRYLFQGHITTIRLRSYRAPSDVTDRVGLEGNFEEHVSYEQVLRAHKREYLPKPKWLREALNGNRKLFELRSLGTDLADEVSISVDYNGTRRTVVFQRPERIAPYLDITNHIETDASGHPNFESIHAYALNLLRDLREEIGRPM